MKFDLNNPRKLSIVAIMIALVVALTRPIIPTPIGYTHLGDSAVYFATFAFGPWVGLLAGGLGTAIADVLTGEYAFFAPLSLIVHGLQGLVAGWVYLKRRDILGLALGTLAGGLIVVGGYFLGETLFPIWGGLANAIGEAPFNVVQVLIGSVGALVYLAVSRAYPRLLQSGDMVP
jgi:uncharacterized membrane protein